MSRLDPKSESTCRIELWQQKHALILGWKEISSAPRILKEISWLESEGWVVDTLGLGVSGASSGRHFQIATQNSLSRYVSYMAPCSKWRYQLLIDRLLPKNLGEMVKEYDLLVFHEGEIISSQLLRGLSKSENEQKIHLDLHENHMDSLSRNLVESLIFGRYRKWQLQQLKVAVANLNGKLTISCVSPWISARTSEVLGVYVSTIMNTPPRESLKPSPTNSKAIQLVHHGMGTSKRGIEKTLLAMRFISPILVLNLQLKASRLYLTKLRVLTISLGLQYRVFIQSPVPTQGIVKSLRSYDVEVMAIPHTTQSSKYAIPNKILESIQARLAVVTGPNPKMAKVVLDSGSGIVINGWGVKSIAESISSLDLQAIDTLKKNAHRASGRLSETESKETFM